MNQGRRERADGNSRNVILDVATQLFAEKPYDAVVMRDIARLANVKNPTIYYFFKSKTGLYREAVLSYYQTKVASKVVLPPAGAAVRERIYSVVLQHLRALANDETFFQLLHRELLSTDEVFKRELAGKLMLGLYEYIGDALATTRFGRENRTIPTLMMSMILGYFQVARFQKYLPNYAGMAPDHPAALDALATELTGFIV